MKQRLIKQDTISVVIPIYNMKNYVEKCVESVCRQTYANLQIILVDDGSTDGSGEICDALSEKDPRIYVIHKQNGGLSDARNAGIDVSNGGFLTFVDSDDWLELDMLEILYELCVDYNADISECQYREIYSPTKIKMQKNTERIVIMNSIEALESMLDWNCFKPVAWGKLYKREIVGEVRFPVNKLHEDEFTTYKYIYNAKKLVHIDSVKYNYNRMRHDSITSSFKIDNLDACEAFLERRRFFEDHKINQLEEKMNNAYCITVLNSLYNCFQHNIVGAKLDNLLAQAKKDIQELKSKKIDIYFINELKIASKSLDSYGMHRKQAEELRKELSCVGAATENNIDIKKENEELKQRINDLLNSRTWRLALKVKKILKLNVLIQYLERRKKANRVLNNKQKNGTDLEFDYSNLLFESEYKFVKYKLNRDGRYPLDITKIGHLCEKDLVSIVLPVYNGEDYVALSIDSVLEQTYEKFELIIIDDGSTDSTSQILEEYAKVDRRIKIVCQENLRLPKTLSKGFRMAKGEFFTWTSADNIMHKDFLERFVRDLKDHPNIGMVWGNMRLIDENGDPISDNKWYANEEFPEEVMFPRSVLNLNVIASNYIGAAFMYRAICANLVLDYSEFKFCTEDYDYWMKINELCDLRHTSFEEPLYSYRFHSNSLTSRDKELKITDNRFKLMLLDDFRRDYFLKPLIWTFNGGDDNAAYGLLKAEILKAGHIIVDYARALSLKTNLYERIVCVGLSDENGTYIYGECNNAYMVLVGDDKSNLDKKWDCCISTKDGATFLTDLGDYRGWYTIKDFQTMFSFIDAKAKIKFLYDLEENMDYEMQNNDKISIIIPFSGDIKNIKSCLSSIRGQDAEVEVILTLSEDDYTKELELIKRNNFNVKIIKSFSKNKITMLNSGIWYSSGEIIVFGHDDYIYEESYFSSLRKAMRDKNVKVVCGSVKCNNMMEDIERREYGEHRFYSNKVLENIEKSFAFNVAIKREELLTIGGLYHLSPELKDVYVEASIFGAMQIIMNNNKSIYKNKNCIVYRQNVKESVEMTDFKKSELMGWYSLEQQLILPYDTWTEVIKENSIQLSSDTKKYFLNRVREDFKIKAQVEEIRTYYSSFENPKISVIVPVYNTEKELKRCVDSVIIQTLNDIEIILVDDGSTDNSGKLCDLYDEMDKRIRVIHKENGGLSDARNAGIDCARGDYIMFVDSDDWIDEDMCEILYSLALKENADIAECSYRNVYPDHVDEESGNTGIVICDNAIFALKSQLEWKYFKSVAWNKLYHKQIFADGKRYPKGKYHEDEFFTHQAFFAAKRLAYVDLSKYNYWNGRLSSITGTVNENILDSCYALRSRVDFAVENGLKEVENDIKNMYCWMLFDRLYQCYKSGVKGPKLLRLLADVKADKNNVLLWNVADEYKAEYKILLESYELFCKCRDNEDLHNQMKRKYAERM